MTYLPNLQVNANGVLSFQSPFLESMPVPFPLRSRDILIAPFWDVFDVEQGGQILFRHTSDAALLTQVNLAIDDDDFSATLAFIATWDSVPGYLQLTARNVREEHAASL